MHDIEVVIATYNSQATVGQTLESIANQTTLPGKIQVVDDGSVDQTISEVSKFASDLNIEVTLFNENLGLWAARNAGVEKVKSPYIAFIDSDDIVLPRHLELHSKAFTDGVHAVATKYFDWIPVGDLVRLDPRVFPDRKKFTEEVFKSNFMPSFSSIRSSVFRELGGFRPGVTEDWDLWIRFFQSGFLAKSMDEPTYLYRWSDRSLSRQPKQFVLSLETLNMAKIETGSLIKKKLCERTAKKHVALAFFYNPETLYLASETINKFKRSTIIIYKFFILLDHFISERFRALLFKRIVKIKNKNKFKLNHLARREFQKSEFLNIKTCGEGT